MKNITNLNLRDFTHIVVASTFTKRLKGLLFKKIERSEALIIPRCYSIHTIGMRYSIDAIFLNNNYKLVKYAYNIKANRFLFCKKAKYVIEIKTEDYLLDIELKLLIIKCIKTLDTSQRK